MASVQPPLTRPPPRCRRRSNATRPAQATLVPDGDGQITSDHGFDLAADAGRLAPYVAQLKQWGVRVSVFMDAGNTDLAAAKALGMWAVGLVAGLVLTSMVGFLVWMAQGAGP